MNQTVENLKKEVLEANLDLVKHGLVILTWGNVSAFDPESGLVVIKASGVEYDKMGTEHMVVVDMDGKTVDGDYNPSSDLPTHLVLYKKFSGIRSVVHTHSEFATIWAQAGRSIPDLGTTHSDYFCGDIPCTRIMTAEEIAGPYEENTGHVIVERFKELDYQKIKAVLVHSHGTFVWDSTPSAAIHNCMVLEYIAKMAYCNMNLADGRPEPIQTELMLRHYERKFGKNAYYGQKK